MKKAMCTLFVLICIPLLLIACTQDRPSQDATELTPTPIEHFTYEEANGSITITKYTGSDTAVVIPESINDLPVTQIRYNAFFMNSTLVSVVLPKTVTSIGNSAFERCTSLTTVTLPENLEEIGGLAFGHCEKLSDITIPNSVKLIVGQAFINCKSLKEVTIPKDCSLGIEAFYGSGLETLTLESGITRISDTCFASTNIQTLVLPQTVHTIGWQAFADCKNLKTVSLNEGLEEFGEYAFRGTAIEEIIIPSTVKAIKDTTFSDCSNLDNVKFEGNAPEEFLVILEGVRFPPENVHFTVFYHSNASGFTSPEWNGYPTKIW